MRADGLGGVRDEVLDDAQQRLAVAGDLAYGAELAHETDSRVARQRRGRFEHDVGEVDGLHAKRLCLAARCRKLREHSAHAVDGACQRGDRVALELGIVEMTERVPRQH